MKTIQALELIPRIDSMLIDLLSSLKQEDWEKPTLASRWTIKDVATHLLDGNIRGISMSRDGYFGLNPENVNSYADLVAFLNRLNADWVKAAKRISPALLITLLEMTGQAYFEHLQTLDPEAEALFSVAWAGEISSKNWFHIAREYTEKWHHQQQIRQALGQEEVLLDPELYLPFLDTSMRALPHHYRSIPAAEGTLLSFEVVGVKYHWLLVKEPQGWILADSGRKEPDVSVRIPGNIAWRIFTKGIGREEARSHLQVKGDEELGGRIVEMLAVMA